MNGDVDTIGRVDPKTVHLLERVDSLNILEVKRVDHGQRSITNYF